MGTRKMFTQSKCVVCREKPPDVTFECHQCLCKECFDNLLKHAQKLIPLCPLCRAEITLAKHDEKSIVVHVTPMYGDFNDARSYYLAYQFTAFMLIFAVSVVMIAEAAFVHRLNHDLFVCTNADLIYCFNKLVDLDRDGKLSIYEIAKAHETFFTFSQGFFLSVRMIMKKCDKNMDNFIDHSEIIECLDNAYVESATCHVCVRELKPLVVV